MGVKDLWLILSPVCEKKSLWELQNQIVAIDLSVWICENQTVDHFNNNLYLRNLFFRTSCMLLLGIKPIFVLEGVAPELKHDEIKRRRELQMKSQGRTNRSNASKTTRSRLKSLQKQCEELLNCMGVTCIYGNGEAEALCALLNEKGVVDGVITKDSDCFLYGARTVYRNFNISCNGGTFEKYDMETIEKKLHLGRNKLIALSLLCGCDYNERGVEGIGKETALKYLATVSDVDVLDRLAKWKDEPRDNETMSKVEKNIKQKACLNPQFPFYDIQNEFLNHRWDELQLEYEWKRPNIKEFVMLVERKLGWPTDYAIEKFLPLLSRWHLLCDKTSGVLRLDCVIKKRNLRGVPSYEVKWTDFDQHTIEPMSYIKLKYQSEIEEFEAAKKKSKGVTKKSKNKEVIAVPQLDRLVDDIHNLSIDFLDDLPVSSTTTQRLDAFPVPTFDEESITVSDFECSATDLLELSAIVESIVSSRQ